jgi:chemotaxis protein histidine kinase CheA
MVDVQSTAGKGTTVRVKIPLTLAIVPALIVRCNGERFAIPQISLTELVRLEAGKGIEMVHGSPVYRLRGKVLPLVYLRQTLKAHHPGTDAASQVAARGELMDFEAAREKHHQWLERLKELLAGKATMTVEQAGSPRDCALGKWLYGVGLKEYQAIPEIRILEQTHKNFHEAVREVVSATVNHHEAQASEAFAHVTQLSRKVVELLYAVEKQALELQAVNIVVLQAEDRQFGLVVDEITDTQEIVVKPLGKQLKGIPAYSGATIMGDGRVALILDVLGLAQRAKVIAEVRDSKREERRGELRQEGTDESQALLLAENGNQRHVAIPLSLVARLEEFPATVVEHAGAQEVMQYRGQIIPLLRLSQILPAGGGAENMLAEGSSIQVVVYSEGGRTVGLIVDRIVDIIEEHAAVEAVAAREGVFGSFVAQRHVTDLLDVPAIVRAGVPGFLDTADGKSV